MPAQKTWIAIAALVGGCSLQNALNAGSAETADATSRDPDDDDDGDVTSTVAGSDDTDATPTGCADRIVRVATHNVESIGATGSQEYDALGSIVLRLAPDLVCFQEVQYFEGNSLDALKNDAGYTHAVQADESPAIGGDHTNACIAKFPLQVVGSWGGRDLSTDAGANDVGRDIFVVRAYVGAAAGDDCRMGAVVLHLKSGQEPVDWFRRQVEIERAIQAIDRYRELYPDDPIVVLGDFNESTDDPAIGHVFDAIPSGLPASYSLGSDIALPLSYQPFARLQSAGFGLAAATQEDSTTLHGTWRSIRLDYLWYAGAELLEDEVYNSLRDDGTDADPPGNYLDKAGEPLPGYVSELASDHFPVVADLKLR